MIFYYVRHGDPIYNPDSLTELGQKQAKLLSKRFALYGLDEVYCSSSNRAQLTAKPTCELLNKDITLLDWAHEGIIYSELSIEKENGKRNWFFREDLFIEKLNSNEVKNLGQQWYNHPDFKQYNFENSVNRINQETDNFFLSLGFKHDRENSCFTLTQKNEKRIAFFAHEGFGKMFLSSLLDIPYPLISTRFEFGHSSVSVINFDETKEKIYPQVLQWSNDSHLYKDSLLTGYQNKIDI